MQFKDLGSDELRTALVAIALEWQRRYGVAPAVTSAISEYDAARLVGHTPESLTLDCVGRTAVSRGADFRHGASRYQVKACRPSGNRGSVVTRVPKASNFDWDLLIWILYDREFRLLEAWEWTVEAYKLAFERVERLSPSMMREGRALHLPSHIPALESTLMPVTSMSQMWTLLNAYTISANGEERPVNHNNEWGGYSRYLKMPVFTGWRDHTSFDKGEKTTTALVLDKAWTNRPVGTNNQERWIRFALESNNGIAAFFVIHAADEHAEVRKVKYIDDDKVFVGKVVRDGGKVYVVGKPRSI